MAACLRDRSGATSIIIAFSAAAILALAALAVDLGSVFLQSRQLQGMADLAALAAARDLPNAQAAAEATARANGWAADLTVTVTRGVYVADRSTGAADRFQPTEVSPNAVRVTLASKADLYFGRAIVGEDATAISRTATAARAELAAFSVGSRLLSLNGGVANALLSGLTGSTVSLSAMDYNALISSDVDLFSYLSALRTDLDLKGASFEKVLEADISTGQALTVLSTLLRSQGDDRAASAVNTLAVAAGSATTARLDRLFDLGPYADQDELMGGSQAGVAISAMDLASATLQLAQGGRQVKLDLGASVPGLADVDVWLAIGERPNNSPWLGIDRDGSLIIRTAQTRVYVEAKVGTGSAISGLAQLKVPVIVEAASAEAKLTAINCAIGSASLGVKPSIGDAWIGEIDTSRLDNFKRGLDVSDATLARTRLLSIKGRGRLEMGGVTWQSVNFSAADIKGGVIKTVSTGDLAKGLAAGLVTDTYVSVDFPGVSLGLTRGVVTDSVTSVLSSAAAPLDEVINTVTGLAGVRLGEADVRVSGLRCKDSALVA
ncbi:MAG: hypothetical protein KF842_07730 [Caulobacter sp.]|nr:hypothetical protein [Caulobacter sp.]